MWFPKGNKSQLVKFTKKWFRPYIVQYVLQNNTALLVTIEKFETNLVLVSVNKFKPYKYMESEVHKKEQQMSIWEQSAGGVQEVISNIEEDDEGCEIQKPQMKNVGNKE